MRKQIFVAGHSGLVGSAIVRKLLLDDNCDVITRTHCELDLVDQRAVADFFATNNIDEVYIAAAKVGGIYANNQYPADFIYQNLMIETNIIHQAYEAGIKKLLFLGSSCIYPKFADQPMGEAALLTSSLEPTNEPYAIAKIAGIKLCESYNRQYDVDFRSVMPTNLYGEYDNFHPENSHVIPALIRRFHEAKCNSIDQVQVWGSGTPLREFLHVDDLAEACLFIMHLPDETYRENTSPTLSHINVGTGEDCTIAVLAETIAEVTEFKGNILFDSSKPDGAPRKLIDVSRINAMGWYASIGLKQGLARTYEWFVKNQKSFRS